MAIERVNATIKLSFIQLSSDDFVVTKDEKEPALLMCIEDALRDYFDRFPDEIKLAFDVDSIEQVQFSSSVSQ